MKNQRANRELILLERRVLHALCLGADEGSLRNFARTALEHYRWQDPIHQALFSAITAIPGESLDAVRDQLPARLTRMGYPDVVWEDLLEPQPFSRAEAEQWVRQLQGSEKGF